MSPSSSLQCLLVLKRAYDKDVQCGLLKDLVSLTLCRKPTEAFQYAIHIGEGSVGLGAHASLQKFRSIRGPGSRSGRMYVLCSI